MESGFGLDGVLAEHAVTAPGALPLLSNAGRAFNSTVATSRPSQVRQAPAFHGILNGTGSEAMHPFGSSFPIDCLGR